MSYFGNAPTAVRHGTEADIAAELEEMGVARQDIMLGFRSPAVRPYAGYAA